MVAVYGTFLGSSAATSNVESPSYSSSSLTPLNHLPVDYFRGPIVFVFLLRQQLQWCGLLRLTPPAAGEDESAPASDLQRLLYLFTCYFFVDA
ncbi:unnamed protein product [Linum trigynum]|uniref:Uncharacterized protein n=1 Tax=Linum trigynum TaxID=586398 RepID=A0AAV2EAT4_9ROSI